MSPSISKSSQGDGQVNCNKCKTAYYASQWKCPVGMEEGVANAIE